MCINNIWLNNFFTLSISLIIFIKLTESNSLSGKFKFFIHLKPKILLALIEAFKRCSICLF